MVLRLGNVNEHVSWVRMHKLTHDDYQLSLQPRNFNIDCETPVAREDAPGPILDSSTVTGDTRETIIRSA